MTPTLFDHLGRPIEMKTLEQEIASPVSGVRDIWHDSQATSLTPSKLATILAELREGETTNFITLADEIEEREPHYASVIGTRKNALSGIEPVVEAASDDQADIDRADEIRELLRRPEFDNLTDDALDALHKGFSVSEILWDTSERQWMPRDYRFVDQRWFQFDKKTLELRFKDKEIKEGIALDPFKWIIHYPRLKTGFPVSSGLARLAAVAFMCKNYAIKDWMRFIEIYGMATRVGRYGPNATPQDKAILKRAVINIGADAAAIIPDSMKIEFVQPGNQNAGLLLYKGTAEWLDKQMSKAVLGQTASSEGTPGSLGNQSGQEEVRRDILKKDARKLAATYNRYLVRPYIDLNHGPQTSYPAIKWIIKDPEDVKALSDSVVQLVDRGLRVSQSEMRDKLGLADPDDDAEVLVSPKASSTGSPVPAMNRRTDRNGQKRTALNAAGDGEDIVDELERIALDGWEPAMTPLADALQQLADECETAEEFNSRLPEIVDAADLTDLTKSLAIAMFKARGAGDAE